MKLIKLKKILASLTATALALTTMAFAPATVSAADIDLSAIDNNVIPMSELQNAVKAKINFNVSDLGSGWSTLTVISNTDGNNGGTGWVTEKFAPTSLYTASQGTDWQINNELTATGDYSSTLDFKVGNSNAWGYQIRLQAGGDNVLDADNTDIVAKITSIEFLDATSNVIKIYDSNAPSIGTDNFTYSELENVNLGKGDTVTIKYDCDNVPATAAYMIKYKVNTPTVTYYTAVDNGNISTDGEADTGMVVTKSTSGTVTTFTFTGTTSSIADFGINVEVSASGNYSDVQYLWFGQETKYKVTVPSYNITVDSAITNGTVTADKTTDLSEGDKVTLTVTPDEGYILDSISATASDGSKVTISEADYSFTMPAADVTVTASFVEKPDDAMDYTLPTDVNDMVENKVYVQEAYTSSNAATKSVRFVARISRETAEKNCEVTFKISNGSKEAAISSPITKVYTSVKSAGQVVYADPVNKNNNPEYVFVVYTVKDVPMGVDLTVPGGLSFTAVE